MNKFFLILSIISCNAYSLHTMGISPGKALVATSVYKTLNKSSKANKEEEEQLKEESDAMTSNHQITITDWLLSAVFAFLIVAIMYVVDNAFFRNSNDNRTPGKYSMLHYNHLPLELPHVVHDTFSFFLYRDDLIIHDSCIYHSKSKTFRKLKVGWALTVFLSKSERIVITKTQKNTHLIQNLTNNSLYYRKRELIDLSSMAPSDYNNANLRI